MILTILELYVMITMSLLLINDNKKALAES